MHATSQLRLYHGDVNNTHSASFAAMPLPAVFICFLPDYLRNLRYLSMVCAGNGIQTGTNPDNNEMAYHTPSEGMASTLAAFACFCGSVIRCLKTAARLPEGAAHHL